MTDEQRKYFLSKIAGLTQATWYSLDRAISREGHAGEVNVLQSVKELVELGWVEETPGRDAALPIYKLTEKGHTQL